MKNTVQKRSKLDSILSNDVPAFDIKRLIFDTNSTFNPLHQESLFECQTAGAHDGRVFYNVALPHEMARFFVVLLESMTSVFRIMDIRSKSATAKIRCIDPSEISERERVKREYTETVCSLYDGFLSDGHSVNESVRLTNSALKSKSHPWATYHLVSTVLRSEGRFRKSDKKGRKKS